MSLVFCNFQISKLSKFVIMNHYTAPNAIIIHFKIVIKVIFSKLGFQMFQKFSFGHFLYFCNCLFFVNEIFLTKSLFLPMVPSERNKGVQMDFLSLSFFFSSTPLTKIRSINMDISPDIVTM